MYDTLYIIGNGFDLMHGMNTHYSDFYNWLLSKKHFDVVCELEDIFADCANNSVLWCDFETALGQYDVEMIAGRNMKGKYVLGDQDGRLCQFVSGSFVLEVALNDIIDKYFTLWVRSIEVAHEQRVAFEDNSLFLTFNYTDTLESLYKIDIKSILHIHGFRNVDDKLIVGHRNYVEPTIVWRNDECLRENNERFQRICDMNELYKPVEAIVESHQAFWQRLFCVKKVEVLGHSCNNNDYLYFENVNNSVAPNAMWTFIYHTESDKRRMKQMAKDLKLMNYSVVRNIT